MKKAVFYVVLVVMLMGSVVLSADFWDGINSTTSPIYRSGNVGIGTFSAFSTPTAPMHFVSSEGTIIKLQQYQSTDHLILGSYDYRGGNRWNIDMLNTNNWFSINYDSNYPTFRIHANGNVVIGSTAPTTPLHSLTIDGGVLIDNYLQAALSTGMDFKTDDGTTRIKILDNGYIGIGTTDPDNKLTVYNGRITVKGTYPEPQIELHNLSTNRMFTLITDGDDFKIHNDGIVTDTPTVPFFIDGSNDRIGFGTTTPQADFDFGIGEPTMSMSNRSDSHTREWGDYAGGYIEWNDSAGLRGGWIGYGGSYDENYYTANERPGKDIRFKTTPVGGSPTNRMTIDSDGNVGIGTTSPDYELDVIGTIRAQEVIVNLDGADFVFEENYELRELSEVENFISEHNHLPEIPAASDMQNGQNMGELSVKLLQKIEELTLYLIDIQKENQELKGRISSLENTK